MFRFKNKEVNEFKICIFICLIFFLLPLINSDITSINSGGGDEIAVTPGKYIEGFFSCFPETCATLGVSCNNWSNSCGTIINCGTCDSGFTCTAGTCVEDETSGDTGDTTTTTTGSSGGGGGIVVSTTTKQGNIVVSSPELSISATEGVREEREVGLKNEGEEPILVTIEIIGEELKKILTLEENQILLKPNEEIKLKLIINSGSGKIITEINPLNYRVLSEYNKNDITNLKTNVNTNKIEFLAEPSEEEPEIIKNRLLVGKILIKYSGLVKEIPVVIGLKSENFLFDVSVSLSNQFKKISPRENLSAQFNLIEVNINKKVDVVATYIIKDFEGNKYYEESETFSLLGEKNYIKEIPTENLGEGKYVLGFEIVYPGAFAVSSVTFDVQEEKIIGFDFNYTYLLILGLIILLILIIIFAIKIFKTKKKLKKKIKRKI